MTCLDNVLLALPKCTHCLLYVYEFEFQFDYSNNRNKSLHNGKVFFFKDVMLMFLATQEMAQFFVYIPFLKLSLLLGLILSTMIPKNVFNRYVAVS